VRHQSRRFPSRGPDEYSRLHRTSHLPVPSSGTTCWSLIYIGLSNSENLPLTATITNLVNSLGGGWYYLGAAAFLSMALPLLVFFGLQRYFVRGIVGGAVKGAARCHPGPLLSPDALSGLPPVKANCLASWRREVARERLPASCCIRAHRTRPPQINLHQSQRAQ
jgi:hypothetical protein